MLNNYFFHEGYFFKEFSQKGFLLFLYNFQNELYKFTFFKKERKKLFFFLVAISSFFSLCQMRIFFSWKKFFFLVTLLNFF